MMQPRIAAMTLLLMTGRVLGAGTIFLAQILVARLLGAAALADYLVILATANLLAVILPAGFQTTAQFFAARYLAAGEIGLLHGFLREAWLIVAGLTFLLAVVVAALPLLPGLSPAVQDLLPVAALAAVFLAATSLGCGVAIGLRRPMLGMVPDMLVKPLALLAATAFVAWTGNGGGARVVVVATAGLAVAAIGQWFLLRRTLIAARVLASEPSQARATWWTYAPAWLTTMLVVEFFLDLDLLLLATLLSKEDLAVFGSVARLTALAGFSLTAIYSIALPDLVASGRAPVDSRFNEKLGGANRLAVLVGIVCIALAFVFGGLVLRLFGPEFERGHAALVILTATLTVRAGFGPASVILSLANRPFAVIPVLVAGVGVLFGLNLLLTPKFGLSGAAFAAFLAIFFTATAQWQVTLRLTGRDSSAFAGKDWEPQDDLYPEAGTQTR